MQYDQAAGLQTGKIQPCRESEMAADTTLAKPLKLTFSPEWLDILAEILNDLLVGP